MCNATPSNFINKKANTVIPALIPKNTRLKNPNIYSDYHFYYLLTSKSL